MEKMPPMCTNCRRFKPWTTCDAYPDGIPPEIMDGEWDHRVPKPGDGGLVFEPLPGTSPEPWWPAEEDRS